VNTVRRSGLWLVLFVALLAAPCAAEAATCTWTGLAADNNWSSAGNWDGCGGAHPTPEAGDSLVFPAGTARAMPVNDLVNLSVAGIQITGAPAPGDRYIIFGNTLRLAGELRFSAPANLGPGAGPQIDAPLVLDGATVISNLGTGPAYLLAIDVNGASLTFAPDTESITVSGTISGAGGITKQASHMLRLRGANTFTGPLQIAAGIVRLGGHTKSALGSPDAGTTVAAGATLVMEGGSESVDPLTLDGGTLTGDGQNHEYTEMKWNGPVALTANASVHTIASCRLYLVGAISGSSALTISGRVVMSGANPGFTGQTIVSGDLELRRGSLANSAMTVTNTGYLTGGGTLGAVTVGGRLFPYGGVFEDLQTGDLTLNTGAELEHRVSGRRADNPVLRVTGTVTLANATLKAVLDGMPIENYGVTIVENDGIDPVVGTFAGLPEGATRTVGGSNSPVQIVISYKGGTGNDVTLTVQVPTQYFLSEGATGSFFDEDILIANPNTVAAPITLTFLTPGGTPIVQERTLPAQSRTTIHVDQIDGLEATDVSTVVKSTTPGLSLAVERTMFWDSSYYAGHTGTPAEFPAQNWYFAEGSQGFFRTYLQLANPGTYPAPATITFLRENAPPVEREFTIGAQSRLTVDCGTIDELANSSFAIHVFAIGHIIAERAMYFGNTPERLFSGGHESAGTRPAVSWFFAEGATGDFFDTFLLFGNVSDKDATVTLQYLLDTGETVTRVKTVRAKERLTVNIGQEDDPRLHHAAVSTLVTSDVPIVAERSMYWGRGESSIWREGHNSFGVLESHTHWGVAEGRIGGPLNFRTYIQLANPQTDAAEVTVTFLRETDAPIVKTYTVPPTSRFNIDVAFVDPDMHDESVGADIRVTNGMGIVVERSMYWDSGGVFFKGGTNATGMRLP
jgi:autotransporter-associated beta strand protein